MPDNTLYEIFVFERGEADKYLAWTMAKAGRQAAAVERGLISGFFPNMACSPSKKIIQRVKALHSHSFNPDAR